jgi:D-alanyl-D-alanine carboxypeptidase (penicillin-binding protein 5/6)
MSVVTRVGLLGIAALAFVVTSPVPARSQNGRPLSVNAESVLLVDPEGRIIYAKNPDEAHAPASLVKMMTLYLALEDIEAGRVGWEDQVTITRRATTTARYRMGLRAGEQVTLRVLLEGVGIASANDAAAAVAEYLGGDEDLFVARMNAKAAQLGLTQTRFANSAAPPGTSPS